MYSFGVENFTKFPLRIWKFACFVGGKIAKENNKTHYSHQMKLNNEPWSEIATINVELSLDKGETKSAGNITRPTPCKYTHIE